MATSNPTFKVIRDPNRPLQIDRAAYEQALQLLREAESLFQNTGLVTGYQARALQKLGTAIDTLLEGRAGE